MANIDTDTDIDKMEAGREMDALIAEKVMGWTAPKKKSVTWYMPNGAGCSVEKIPNYSTDIAAAWEVADKIHDLGWNDGSPIYWLTLCRTNIHPPVYAVCFENEDFEDEEWYEDDHIFGTSARGETASLAICRAALKCDALRPAPSAATEGGDGRK